MGINLLHASSPRGLPSQALGLGSGSGSGPGRRSSTAASDDPSLKRALTVSVCCCVPSLCDGSRLLPEQPCVCSGPVLVGYKQCISCGSALLSRYPISDHAVPVDRVLCALSEVRHTSLSTSLLRYVESTRGHGTMIFRLVIPFS